MYLFSTTHKKKEKRKKRPEKQKKKLNGISKKNFVNENKIHKKKLNFAVGINSIGKMFW